MATTTTKPASTVPAFDDREQILQGFLSRGEAEEVFNVDDKGVKSPKTVKIKDKDVPYQAVDLSWSQAVAYYGGGAEGEAEARARLNEGLDLKRRAVIRQREEAKSQGPDVPQRKAAEYLVKAGSFPTVEAALAFIRAQAPAPSQT